MIPPSRGRPLAGDGADDAFAAARGQSGAKGTDMGSGHVPANASDRALQLVAWVMDNLFRVPGTQRRFGLDPIIGLIPGVGNGANALMSAATILRGAQRGVPKVVLMQMALNILLDSGLGSVPVVGNAFSFWFKSFARNYSLLEKHSGSDTPAGLAARNAPASTRGSRIFVWLIVALGFLIPIVMMAFLVTVFTKIWNWAF